jgi:hypothetical protein
VRHRRWHEFKSEAELVAATGEWLRADGWSCFYEVAPWGSGAARADIVATRGPLLAVVECKMTLGLAVLEQCETWLEYAHVIWAAVPWGGRSHLVERVAEWLGVGIAKIGRGYSGATDGECLTGSVEVHAALRRKVNHERIRRHLSESAANHQPGNNHSFSTPYTETCARLLGIVTEAGGRIAAKDAIGKLQHHYRGGAACARSVLVRRAEAGQVSGLRIAREGRAVFFEVAS